MTGSCWFSGRGSAVWSPGCLCNARLWCREAHEHRSHGAMDRWIKAELGWQWEKKTTCPDHNLPRGPGLSADRIAGRSDG